MAERPRPDEGLRADGGRPPSEAWPSADVLGVRASTTPGRTAIVDATRDESLTFGDLLGRADSIAAELSLGDPDRQRVGVLLETRPSFAAVVFAAIRRAVTAVPLNRALDEATLCAQAERADLDVLVCSDETESDATAVAPCPVVSVDGAATDEVADPPASETAFAHEALLMFTSGTTGDPKGVRLTVGNLLASAVASAFRLGVDPADRWLAPLPMYHMGGLAPAIRSTLYGTTTVLQREFDATATADVIADCDVTGVSLVPTMLTRLLDAGWSPPAHLRFVLLGGGPAGEDLIERCEKRGVPVYPSYGTTETASQIATATPAQAFDSPGTVGHPLLGTTVEVVDDGHRCDPDEVGELVVAGPTVTPGYLDAERESTGGVLRTGDLGYRDADGRLHVVGRVDDTIVTGGENVHPATVADAIRECPGVEDAAVVGLDDEEWGQRVAAAVVGDVSLAALEEHCRDRLGDFQRPKTVAVLDALPRTASGTVDRAALRQRLRTHGVDR
jgi:O-succinylbenzoic acid--CoA ligase